MPDIRTDLDQVVADAEKALRDGAYVAVGLGVIAFQRAQVRRREVLKRLEAERSSLAAQLESTMGAPIGDLGTARTQLAELARSVDEAVAPLRREVDRQVDSIEARLPAGARDAVETIRAAVAGPESAVRSALGLA